MPTCPSLECCNTADTGYTVYDYALLNIAADVSPAGWGTVTGTGQYSEGDTVTLTGIPDDSDPMNPKKVLGWYDEAGFLIVAQATYVFTAMSPRRLTCLFGLI